MIAFTVAFIYIGIAILSLPLMAKLVVWSEEQESLKRGQVQGVVWMAVFWPLITATVVFATPFIFVPWLWSKFNISGDGLYTSLERMSRRKL